MSKRSELKCIYISFGVHEMLVNHTKRNGVKKDIGTFVELSIANQIKSEEIPCLCFPVEDVMKWKKFFEDESLPPTNLRQNK